MTWDRILATAPQVDDRNGVEYFEVRARSLLNQVRRDDLPFDRSINPYLNCEVGCTYCYARDFSRKRQAGQGSFDREVYAKQNAAEVLRRELAHLSRTGQLGAPIAIGTATDPYQPLEKRQRLTRKILTTLADHGGVRVSITTKSDLILRDLDVLQELARTGHVRVNVTITTTDRTLARSMEPRAPTPIKRLRAVEGLAAADIPVGVLCMPLLPHINDDSRSMRRLVCAVKDAGARWLSARILALAPGVREAFFAWLAEARPGLVLRYRRWYSGSSQAPEWLADPIERTFDALTRQYRIPAQVPFPEARPAVRRQLDLFEQPFSQSTQPSFSQAAGERASKRAPRRLPTAHAGAA